MDRRIANRCLRASASYCPLSPLCARSIHSHFLWLYSAAGVYYTSTYQGVANSAGCSTVDNCRRCMLNWWIEAGTCWTNWPNFRQLCGFRMVVTLRSRAVRDANDNTTKEEVLTHNFLMHCPSVLLFRTAVLSNQPKMHQKIEPLWLFSLVCLSIS